MSYINLLDILYPIGSLYFSTIDESPAKVIGGTWTKINDDALIGAGNGYGGSRAITSSYMPTHSHIVKSNYPWGKYIGSSNRVNDGGADGYGLASGGGFNNRAIVNFENYTSNAYGTTPTGGGSNYIPYYFGVHIWLRTG